VCVCGRTYVQVCVCVCTHMCARTHSHTLLYSSRESNKFPPCHCNTLQRTATHYTTLQYSTKFKGALNKKISTLSLQHNATQCNTLQRVATRCNTPQNIQGPVIEQISAQPEKKQISRETASAMAKVLQVRVHLSLFSCIFEYVFIYQTKDGIRGRKPATKNLFGRATGDVGGWGRDPRKQNSWGRDPRKPFHVYWYRAYCWCRTHISLFVCIGLIYIGLFSHILVSFDRHLP